jgi:two-component system chemotaxis response regulator CheB
VSRSLPGRRFELVVAVASFGGFAAARSILGALPATFDVPFLLVQHRAPGSDDEQYAHLLKARTSLPVRVARPGMTAAVPGVTLMPADATVRLGISRQFGVGEPTALHDRSGAGDALFAAAAAVAGPATIGVVLTGRLCDGTEGARAVKRAGGRVLAQDPAGASAGSMPLNAVATGCVDFVLPLEGIAPALVALTMAPGAADLFAVPTPPWAQLGA